MKTILIAGLGNPGTKYARTRHNAGFLFADYFFEKYRDDFGLSDWEMKKKLDAEISMGKWNGGKIILLKPQTFMNLSGKSILAAKKYNKVKLENVIVSHDEIDLPMGSFRISCGSSSAGHKGVQNVIDALGTKNFIRIRIGIRNRAGKKIETEKYVLNNFTKEELNSLRESIKNISSELAVKLKAQNLKRKTTTQN